MDVTLWVYHIYLMGNKALNDLMMVFSGSENSKAGQNTPGGWWIVKSRFARGKKVPSQDFLFGAFTTIPPRQLQYFIEQPLHQP